MKASGSATADKMVDELRSRLDDVQYENVTLKNNLTEAQTTVVVLRTETTTLKQQFQEKCRELDRYVASNIKVCLPATVNSVTEGTCVCVRVRM